MGEEKVPDKEPESSDGALTAEQWIEKGIAQLKTTYKNAAITYFNRALDLEPDNVKALLHKGIAADMVEQHDMAIKIFEGLIDKGTPTDIVEEAKILRAKAIANRKLTKVRNTRKKIREMGEGGIFSTVTCFMCLGVIASVIFFFVAMDNGFIDVGIIVSIAIYLVMMCAWVNVEKKFKTSSELLREIYEELKKQPDEEKKDV